MKKSLLFLCFCALFTFQTIAQLNLTLVSNLEYDEVIGDVWGYVAPDSTEYALVGAASKISVVSLSDPANPVEVASAPATTSVWHDIKTWDNYAYAVTDAQGSDGLIVIDLNHLPDSVSSYSVPTSESGFFSQCHNLYIDEFGYGYVVGCGGIIIFDMATDPANPTIVANMSTAYSHDVYVRNNLLYSSEINNGLFSIYDVSDKSNIELLATQNTFSNKTHNTWLSDDGNVLFTTDEIFNGTVGAYDVSDPNNIIELDQFNPLSTPEDNAIPHNVHVKDDWVVTSYYTDGCVIIDGSNPGNLVEVANYDTYLPQGGGFKGAWGAYPFLPSELILVSDKQFGLFVLEPNYQRACWLEGNVTDEVSGLPINNASMEIVATQPAEDITDAAGDYATGLATAGTYDATFHAVGYYPATHEVVLENGEITIQDVQLTPLPTYDITGQFIETIGNITIPDAEVLLRNNDIQYTTVTDAAGNFSLPAVYYGSYELFVGRWGYYTQKLDVMITAPTNYVVETQAGYRDEFALDLGWQVITNAGIGVWTIDEPIGTLDSDDQYANPEEDLSFDLGDQCYVTGNGSTNIWADDVGSIPVRLNSPPADLSTYNNPIASFYLWFYTGLGGVASGDQLDIRVSNGVDAYTVLTIDVPTDGWEGPFNFAIGNYFPANDNITISFEVADEGDSDFVEVAIDLFEIYEGLNHTAFSADQTEGCAPLSVEFTDNGTDASSWMWVFEGGTPSSSTLQNPTVVYDSPGSFPVSLLVETPAGLATTAQYAFIEVIDEPAPDFTYTIDNASVSFNNTTTNADSFVWSFGDGATSTDVSPSHLYTSSGIYPVVLTATNDCGTVTEEQTVIINIVGTADIDNTLLLNASPNPFSDQLSIQYNLQQSFEQAQLVIYNIMGQAVYQQNLTAIADVITINGELKNGIYLARIEVDGTVSQSHKLIKVE